MRVEVSRTSTRPYLLCTVKIIEVMDLHLDLYDDGVWTALFTHVATGPSSAETLFVLDTDLLALLSAVSESARDLREDDDWFGDKSITDRVPHQMVVDRMREVWSDFDAAYEAKAARVSQ